MTNTRDFFGNTDTSVDRVEVPAKREPTSLWRCEDCGKKFRTPRFTSDIECPKCNSVNVEVL